MNYSQIHFRQTVLGFIIIKIGWQTRDAPLEFQIYVMEKKKKNTYKKKETIK